MRTNNISILKKKEVKMDAHRKEKIQVKNNDKQLSRLWVKIRVK